MAEDDDPQTGKIGLALSGGGFRASIFHLGVIRRLEELGLMEKVEVISAVSGGSILAAYYFWEMDRLLLTHQQEYRKDPRGTRLKLLDEIERGFYLGTNLNLRTRAMVFTPFYHPLLFLRGIPSRLNRRDVIQQEYANRFYGEYRLSNLAPDGDHPLLEHGYRRPSVIINTTSLNDGQRVSFTNDTSLVPNDDRLRSDDLPLYTVCGASSAVPGMFPPAKVGHEYLSDGGVSDNQGIEALQRAGCEFLIVSDASQLMDRLERPLSVFFAVLARSSEIMNAQIRKKLLNATQQWADAVVGREMVLIHLKQSVENGVPPRYVEPLAHIRTDLDEFSGIEREMLSYHGYTLIDHALADSSLNVKEQLQRAPPVARKLAELEEEETSSLQTNALRIRKRELIARELRAGAKRTLLMRTLDKYRWQATLLYLLSLLLPLAAAGIWLNPSVLEGFRTAATDGVEDEVKATQQAMFDRPLGWVSYVVVLFLLTYVFLFLSFVIVRILVLRWDAAEYRYITGESQVIGKWE